VSYALKLAGAAILFLVAGLLILLLFEGIWTRVGLGAAVIVVVGGLLFFAWRTDKKARESRAGLDRI
jgi:hypothetical protein